MAKESLGGIQYVFKKDVFIRNGLMALVVGALLTLANQMDVMLTEPFSLRLGTKVCFNFLIPFLVSSVSAAINRRCD